jgi:hypothetical protein
MWLYGLRVWVYNGFAKIPLAKNRTFDEMCSTIYPISYILIPEVNTMNNANLTPHWIPCPACNEKTDVKIYEDTVLVKFPIHCPKCGRETRIDVVKLRMVKSE